MAVERHVQVCNTDGDSLDAALSWVVQQVDGEFKACTMVKISIEQYLTSAGDEEWRPAWSASVAASVDQT